ncbi:serine/threonine protein kinase ELM1 Ecym_2302 [Eremothecium cymbalariae DBVPG|uniref:non-specific serine/threonine protein kinase n=1 Tax=Eremothecium cymbalariae (strain CBS 270.75 / DBVPG 7215 / KCTC 17166 / NRRL Y-17582) TaxID=931890 RepID=G8JQ42_ERECY|nr:Hypothetical protein Ecym_2302 [Eremothecium cymbalariae DBVPG\
MKSYPTLVQFNEGRQSLFLRSFSGGSNSRLTDTPLSTNDSMHYSKSITYSTLFEEYNKLVESVLVPKTSKLASSKTNTQVNQYVIEEKLGKGRYGSVFKAKIIDESGGSNNNSEIVAIKCIAKKPMASLLSMNQIMKQRARLRLTPGVTVPGETPNNTPKPTEGIERRSSTKSLASVGVRYLDSDWIMIEMNLLRIRKECLVHCQLGSHRNVNKVLEIIDSPKSSKVWLVQEFASLGELRWERASKFHTIDQWCKLMRSNSISRVEFAYKILRDIASGLQFLQKCGVIHRDIKPANIVLDGVSGDAKISDFGCATIKPEYLPWWNHDAEKHKWTKAFKDELSKIVGTPAFIPPELCDFTLEAISDDYQEEPSTANKNNRRHKITTYHPDQGFKIDIWSLGVVIFCILENRLPFFGENEFETYHMIVCEELPMTQILSNSSHNESDAAWLYRLLERHLLCKDVMTRSYATDVIALLDKHHRENRSRVDRVKRKLSSWKRKFTRSVSTSSTNPYNSAPGSDLVTGTIFSHSSSELSSIFTDASSINFIEHLS